jgi:hypothetical protein
VASSRRLPRWLSWESPARKTRWRRRGRVKGQPVST